MYAECRTIRNFIWVYLVLISFTSWTTHYKFSILWLLLGMGRPLNACNNCSWCCTGMIFQISKLKYHNSIKVSQFQISKFPHPSFLQSPWGVASGAIAGHLLATCIAILGGAFLANYISEKLVRAANYNLLLAVKNRCILISLQFTRSSIRLAIWEEHCS